MIGLGGLRMFQSNKIGVYVAIFLVCLVSQVSGQENREKKGDHQPVPEVERAWQEVTAILSETRSVQDKNTYVKIQAKTASLVWLKDEELGRSLFNELWSWIQNQNDENFESEAARTALINYLMPRDPKLSKKFLEESSTGQKADDNNALSDSTVKVKRLNNLASSFMENNPAAAAELLEQSVPASPTTEALSLLMRLREKDSQRADKIVALALQDIGRQPIQLALSSIYSLHFYLYPLKASQKANLQAPPSPILQKQFFQAAFETLLRSLQNTEINPLNGLMRPASPPSQLFIQTQLAHILSALSPRFAPDRMDELSRLRGQIGLGASKEITGVAQATADRLSQAISQKQDSSQDASMKHENPIGAISAALSKNNYDEASKWLEKIDSPELKLVMSDQIKISESHRLSEIGQFDKAAQVARNVSSLKNRISALTKIAKLSREKGDRNLSESLIAEVERHFSGVDCDRNKMSILLTFVLEVGSFDKNRLVELLASGVECVNKALAGDGAGSRKVVNGADVQTELVSITQAFSLAGLADLDTTLAITNQIRNHPTRLFARLFACEKWLLENRRDNLPSAHGKNKNDSL